jgi:hypothetical protein
MMWTDLFWSCEWCEWCELTCSGLVNDVNDVNWPVLVLWMMWTDLFWPCGWHERLPLPPCVGPGLLWTVCVSPILVLVWCESSRPGGQTHSRSSRPPSKQQTWQIQKSELRTIYSSVKRLRFVFGTPEGRPSKTILHRGSDAWQNGTLAQRSPSKARQNPKVAITTCANKLVKHGTLDG